MGYETGIPFLKITAQLVDCGKKDLGVTPGYNRSEAGLTEQETADKIRDNLSNERKTAGSTGKCKISDLFEELGLRI